MIAEGGHESKIDTVCFCADGLIEQSRGQALHEAVAGRKCRTRFRRARGREGPGREQRGGGSAPVLGGEVGAGRCGQMQEAKHQWGQRVKWRF